MRCVSVLPFVVISFFFSFVLCAFGRGRFLLSFPNERSAHSVPTSLFGGIAIWFGFLIGSLSLIVYNHIYYRAGFDVTLLYFLIFPSILALSGAIDDRYHLPSFCRLLIQILFCALSLYYFNFEFSFTSLSPFNALILFFLMLAFINAGNFSDGLNGLWSGTVIVWSLYVLFFFGFNSLLLLFLFSLIGFFLWNFPKGHLFMGDSGSTFLAGFVLIYGLILAQKGTFSSSFINTSLPYPLLWFKNMPLHDNALNSLTRLTIVFSPFVFVFSDVVFTLVLRIARGHSPLTPHKEHIKQQLVHKLKLSHTVVTLIYLFGSVLSTFLLGFLSMHGFLVVGLLAYVPIQILFFWGVLRRTR